MIRGVALAYGASLLVACGTNSAGVPDDLLDAIRNQGNGAEYPEGPYGTGVGDVVQNLCFDAWKDPKADGYDPARFQKLCLSDFHADPAARILHVNSSAIWCVACRSEYGGSSGSDGRPSLADHLAERQGDGYRLLGTMFQNAASEPASGADAALWARTYSIEFPFALDDAHQLGLFTSSSIAPFNLLVDTKTMKVVLELEGDEPAVLFGAVDGFLKGAAAE
jgi:hypothetical protein